MPKIRKKPVTSNIGVDVDIIHLIDAADNPPKDFWNKQCLIKYVNYDDVHWMIANAFHDGCFWFENNGLPCGIEWIQEYAFLEDK